MGLPDGKPIGGEKTKEIPAIFLGMKYVTSLKDTPALLQGSRPK